MSSLAVAIQSSDTAAAVVDALAVKLSHTLPEIRERALDAVLSKLRAGLLSLADIASSQSALQALCSWFARPGCAREIDVLALIQSLVSASATGSMSIATAAGSKLVLLGGLRALQVFKTRANPSLHASIDAAMRPLYTYSAHAPNLEVIASTHSDTAAAISAAQQQQFAVNQIAAASEQSAVEGTSTATVSSATIKAAFSKPAFIPLPSGAAPVVAMMKEEPSLAWSNFSSAVNAELQASADFTVPNTIGALSSRSLGFSAHNSSQSLSAQSAPPAVPSLAAQAALSVTPVQPLVCASGFRFAPVLLSRSDERLLFELGLRMRVLDGPTVMNACTFLAHTAINDYPASVWLQSPQPLLGLLEQLHRFAQRPPTESHPHADLLPELVNLARAMIAGWTTLAARSSASNVDSSAESPAALQFSAVPSVLSAKYSSDENQSVEMFDYPPAPVLSDDGMSALDFNAVLDDHTIRTNISLPQVAHWLLLATLTLLRHPSSTAMVWPLLFDCVALLQLPVHSAGVSDSAEKSAASDLQFRERLLRLTPIYLASLGDTVHIHSAQGCLSHARWSPLIELVFALVSPLLPQGESGLNNNVSALQSDDQDSDFENEQNMDIAAQSQSVLVPPCTLPLPLRDLLVAFLQSASPSHCESRPHLRAPVEHMLRVWHPRCLAEFSAAHRLVRAIDDARLVWQQDKGSEFTLVQRVRRVRRACRALAFTQVDMLPALLHQFTGFHPGASASVVALLSQQCQDQEALTYQEALRLYLNLLQHSVPSVRANVYGHLVLAMRFWRDECASSDQDACDWWLSQAPFIFDASTLRVICTIGLSDDVTHASALDFFALLLQRDTVGAVPARLCVAALAPLYSILHAFAHLVPVNEDNSGFASEASAARTRALEICAEALELVMQESTTDSNSELRLSADDVKWTTFAARSRMLFSGNAAVRKRAAQLVQPDLQQYWAAAMRELSALVENPSMSSVAWSALQLPLPEAHVIPSLSLVFASRALRVPDSFVPLLDFVDESNSFKSNIRQPAASGSVLCSSISPASHVLQADDTHRCVRALLNTALPLELRRAAAQQIVAFCAPFFNGTFKEVSTSYVLNHATAEAVAAAISQRDQAIRTARALIASPAVRQCAFAAILHPAMLSVFMLQNESSLATTFARPFLQLLVWVLQNSFVQLSSSNVEQLELPNGVDLRQLCSRALLFIWCHDDESRVLAAQIAALLLYHPSTMHASLHALDGTLLESITHSSPTGCGGMGLVSEFADNQLINNNGAIKYVLRLPHNAFASNSFRLPLNSVAIQSIRSLLPAAILSSEASDLDLFTDRVAQIVRERRANVALIERHIQNGTLARYALTDSPTSAALSLPSSVRACLAGMLSAANHCQYAQNVAALHSILMSPQTQFPIDSMQSVWSQLSNNGMRFANPNQAFTSAFLELPWQSSLAALVCEHSSDVSWVTAFDSVLRTPPQSAADERCFVSLLRLLGDCMNQSVESLNTLSRRQRAKVQASGASGASVDSTDIQARHLQSMLQQLMKHVCEWTRVSVLPLLYSRIGWWGNLSANHSIEAEDYRVQREIDELESVVNDENESDFVSTLDKQRAHQALRSKLAQRRLRQVFERHLEQTNRVGPPTPVKQHNEADVDDNDGLACARITSTDEYFIVELLQFVKQTLAVFSAHNCFDNFHASNSFAGLRSDNDGAWWRTLVQCKSFDVGSGGIACTSLPDGCSFQCTALPLSSKSFNNIAVDALAATDSQIFSVLFDDQHSSRSFSSNSWHRGARELLASLLFIVQSTCIASEKDVQSGYGNFSPIDALISVQSSACKILELMTASTSPFAPLLRGSPRLSLSRALIHLLRRSSLQGASIPNTFDKKSLVSSVLNCLNHIAVASTQDGEIDGFRALSSWFSVSSVQASGVSSASWILRCVLDRQSSVRASTFRLLAALLRTSVGSSIVAWSTQVAENNDWSEIVKLAVRSLTSVSGELSDGCLVSSAAAAEFLRGFLTTATRQSKNGQHNPVLQACMSPSGLVSMLLAKAPLLIDFAAASLNRPVDTPDAAVTRAKQTFQSEESAPASAVMSAFRAAQLGAWSVAVADLLRCVFILNSEDARACVFRAATFSSMVGWISAASQMGTFGCGYGAASGLHVTASSEALAALSLHQVSSSGSIAPVASLLQASASNLSSIANLISSASERDAAAFAKHALRPNQIASRVLSVCVTIVNALCQSSKFDHSLITELLKSPTSDVLGVGSVGILIEDSSAHLNLVAGCARFLHALLRVNSDAFWAWLEQTHSEQNALSQAADAIVLSVAPEQQKSDMFTSPIPNRRESHSSAAHWSGSPVSARPAGVRTPTPFKSSPESGESSQTDARHASEGDDFMPRSWFGWLARAMSAATSADNASCIDARQELCKLVIGLALTTKHKPAPINLQASSGSSALLSSKWWPSLALFHCTFSAAIKCYERELFYFEAAEQSTQKHLMGQCASALLAASPVAKLYALGALEPFGSHTAAAHQLPACLQSSSMFDHSRRHVSMFQSAPLTFAAWLCQRVKHVHSLLALSRVRSLSDSAPSSQQHQQQQQLYRHDAHSLTSCLAHLFKDLHAVVPPLTDDDSAPAQPLAPFHIHHDSGRHAAPLPLAASKQRAAFFAKARGPEVVLAVRALLLPELMAHLWPSFSADTTSDASLLSSLLALCGNVFTVCSLLRVPLQTNISAPQPSAFDSELSAMQIDTSAMSAWSQLMDAAAPDGWWASRHALAVKCLPDTKSSKQPLKELNKEAALAQSEKAFQATNPALVQLVQSVFALVQRPSAAPSSLLAVRAVGVLPSMCAHPELLPLALKHGKAVTLCWDKAIALTKLKANGAAAAATAWLKVLVQITACEAGQSAFHSLIIGSGGVDSKRPSSAVMADTSSDTQSVHDDAASVRSNRSSQRSMNRSIAPVVLPAKPRGHGTDDLLSLCSLQESNAVRLQAALLLRNMCHHSASKVILLSHPQLLPTIIQLLLPQHTSDDSIRQLCGATALAALIYNQQKARALLKNAPMAAQLAAAVQAVSTNEKAELSAPVEVDENVDINQSVVESSPASSVMSWAVAAAQQPDTKTNSIRSDRLVVIQALESVLEALN